MIGTGVNGSGMLTWAATPGQRGGADHQQDVAQQRAGQQIGQDARPSGGGGGHRVRGKPRSTLDVDGSGQREVTTLPRV